MTRLATLALALAVAAPGLASPVAAQAAGAWSLLDASPFHSYRFEDGDFIDPDTGWIVNPNGEVWKTADAGASWDLLGEYPSEYIRSVAFPTAELGFFGTLYGDRILWRSTDGGETFTDITGQIDGPLPQGICGLYAVSENVIYGAGWYDSPAHVVKTTDGGQTWTSRDMSDVAGSLVDVYFWDELRGIAIGGTDGAGGSSRAVVVMTEDGGETWTRRFTSSDSGEWGWKISFPTPSTGYVSIEGNGGKMLKTTDAGLTWTELALPTSADFQGAGFITENVGWTSGRGTMMGTTDGGQTWDPLALDGQINRFEFFGDTLAYAMGTRIYKLDRLSTAAETPTPAAAVAFGIDAAYPNPTAGGLTVTYRTARAASVTLAVFDLLGRRVATLADGARPAGLHEAAWDGREAGGAAVAPGVYVVRLQADGQTAVQRVTVLGR